MASTPPAAALSRDGVYLHAWIRRLSPTTRLTLLVFAIHLFLVSPYFFPSLNDINPWDEAAYINSGRMLVEEGRWSGYSNSPLVSVFYALTYLPFRTSPYWLVQSASLGRPLLFGLLWLSLFLAARQLSRFAHPLLASGIFLVAPVGASLLHFPSDPLFAALSGFSFWQMTVFHETRRPANAAWASLFLGLAALARNDGLVVFPIMVALTLIFSAPGKKRAGALAASLAPFIVIVSSAVILYGLRTGDYRLGTMERTYDNFEVGHGVIYTGPGVLNAMYEGQLEARRVFGEPEENGYSIFKAIARNPSAYLQRVKAFSLGLPRRVLNAYGLRLAAVLLLLAARGGLELFRKKEYRLLALFVLWPAHLLTAFSITLVREGHLMFPFFAVFALGAIGLSALLDNLEQRKELLGWTIALLLLVLYGLFGGKLAVYYGAALMLAAVWTACAIQRLSTKSAAFPRSAALVFLCAGLLINDTYPSPILPALGKDVQEQAVLHLASQFPEGSMIGAASPGPVWMARMTYAGLVGLDVPTGHNPEEFVEWMRAQDIKAVYVDNSLHGGNPWLWDTLQAQIGLGLERIYTADEGNIQILRVKDGP